MLFIILLCSFSLAAGKGLGPLLDITRFRANVLPTCLLTTLAAPSIEIIHSPGFGKAFTMVHLLTSASMVINDIYDQPTDRVNHPERPLVSGRMTEKEAWTTVGVLSGLYGTIGIFLPKQVAPFWIGSWVLIMIYTPVLKKICFVKNLACATTIAATIPFIGLATASPGYSLWGRARFVFAGSLYCEVLMDILDKVGDAMSGIRTLPVLFGNPATLGILTGFMALLQISLYRTPSLMVLIFPLYLDLWRIHRGGYLPNEIKRVCKQTRGLLLVGNLLLASLIPFGFMKYDY
jgi:4-hydroxybenzoate polyprenyltransferase